MVNKLSNTDKTLLASFRTEQTREEIFEGIAASIRNSYEGDMSEEESRRLARNFIGFCQKLIEIQVRLDRDNE